MACPTFHTHFWLTPIIRARTTQEILGRPPVVSSQSPSLNLMLPPRDKGMASTIELEIAAAARHKYFRSFRSSQAMAQSVFGRFKAAGRLDLLSRV